jgi:microcystin-dependent protein
MSEPFVGEIRMFAGNFAPRGWAFCDGQLLAVSQNDALFSLLGTIYGGDGRTTFGLPDCRGRVPIHAGHGPGLSERRLGARGGAEKVTLTTNQLPSHGHPLHGSTANGLQADPGGNVLAGSAVLEPYEEETPTAPMASAAITSVGGSRSHTNLQPFLCINFIIALFGIYPSRH